MTLNAILLGSPEPNTEEWYALRRGGITATDLPQILGKSKFGNARKVWHAKRNELPPEELSEAGLWGHLLEEPVAQEWARRNGQTVSRVGVLANTREPWKRVSCDRLIDGTNAALEVKTRNAHVAGRWRDDLPDDVLAQVAWQRLVGQFDFVEVACLIGGQHMVSYRYEQDSQLEDYLTEAARKVWDLVLSGVPPDVNMDAVLLRLLEQLWPDRSGVKSIAATEAVDLLMDYSSAASLAKIAEDAKAAAKARVLLAMGGAEVMDMVGYEQDGGPLFTYRAQERRSVSLDKLEDNDRELYLKLLEGGHISTSSSRVLRTGKGAKNVIA